MDGSQQEIEYLITQIKDHQICHGGLVKLVRLEDPHTVPARPIAVSIKPTPFPRAQYDKAVALQSCFNELYMRAGSDQAWLHTVFKPILKHDALLNSLWRIAMEVQRAGRVQDKSCGVFRSDYILHATTSKTEIKQVEMNTISVAGACHADRVARMHRHIQTTAKVGSPISVLLDSTSFILVSSVQPVPYAGRRAFVRSTDQTRARQINNLVNFLRTVVEQPLLGCSRTRTVSTTPTLHIAHVFS